MQKKIRKLVEKIVHGYQPEKIILFGSRAYGKPTTESDVDFFTVKKTQKSRIERDREVQKNLWGCKLPVDTLVYAPQEIRCRLELKDFFMEDIFTKGKVLYSKTL